MKKHILLSVFIFCCLSCIAPQRNFTNYSGKLDPSMPMEPGKCFAKSLIQDVYGMRYDTMLVYTGEDLEQDGIKIELIEVAPAKTEWVKKMADKNCLSADPNDCLVWCLRETPADIDTFITVVDTALVREYKTDVVDTKYLVEAGGYTDWVEVMCQNELNGKFVINLRESLMDQGYQVELGDDKMDKDLKKVLKSYQSENALPVGQLDMVTLRSLGLK